MNNNHHHHHHNHEVHSWVKLSIFLLRSKSRLLFFPGVIWKQLRKLKLSLFFPLWHLFILILRASKTCVCSLSLISMCGIGICGISLFKNTMFSSLKMLSSWRCWFILMAYVEVDEWWILLLSFQINDQLHGRHLCALCLLCFICVPKHSMAFIY